MCVAVLGQKTGIADPESSDAATEFPCCFMPCDVILLLQLLLLLPLIFLCANADTDAEKSASWDAA